MLSVTLNETGRQAAFDPRVLATVCFFATDIHSATLGKGKSDDTLIRLKRGDLSGKGEVMVSRGSDCVDQTKHGLNATVQMIFGKQDTHVPRAGRDLIRSTLEDQNVISSVSFRALVSYNGSLECNVCCVVVHRSPSSTCLHSRRVIQRTLGCGPHSKLVQYDDGIVRSNSRKRPGIACWSPSRSRTCMLSGISTNKGNL